MTHEEAIEIQEGMKRNLVEKGTLTLTVKCSDMQQADKILAWMYSATPPMKAELVEIAWNKRVVSAEEYEALQAMKNVLLGG